MEENYKGFCLEVWGDFACFTRPEMKVERVSYDVITPSAARAVFEAILWKPAIKWHVTQIEVLQPIKWITVRRNEVGSTAGKGSKNEIFIENHRQQRAGLFLKDVRYRIHAWMEYIPVEKRKVSSNPLPEYVKTDDDNRELLNSDSKESPGKYLAMFERRAKKGQSFTQPYLGCREFAAYYEYVDDTSHYKPDFPPIDDSRDLGFMLFDMDFSDPSDIRPAFYRAYLKNGVIAVPAWDSQEVRI